MTTDKTKTILITGGSGLIGTRLTRMLRRRGHHVLWYSRRSNTYNDISDATYHYDMNTKEIDLRPLLQADVVIHLAGANIAGNRWTANYKREIIRSRAIPLEMIYHAVDVLREQRDIPLKQIIVASSIGYYGALTSRNMLQEDSLPKEDFLSKTVAFLEERARLIGDKLSVDTSFVRNGIVLSMRGGALPKLYRPVRMGLNTPLGEGNQFVNWIHIDDLCRIYVKLVEGSLSPGTYNGVAPSPVTNEQFMYALSCLRGKFVPKLRIPRRMIELITGEVSNVLLEGSPISSEKLLSKGFKFRYPSLGKALRKSILKVDNY